MIVSRRTVFIATIFVGSFLLFLVQPMVARMALPRLGGAPNVWNSAMLVYQALLLAGYAYAHAIGRLALRRQAQVHLAVLVFAGLTLPIALADLAPPAPGAEVLWVPLLFLATIGAVFFAVAAQAPLMQSWFASDPAAGNPYPLYAASNLGSFSGLIAYPLLLEPLLPLRWQSWGWSLGYVLLAVLVLLASRTLGQTAEPTVAAENEPAEAIGWKRIVLWLALSAVPSGLMLSTTTYLTTDIMAMPLLWVIPLGLYLLSFTVAFAEQRALANIVSRYAAAITITFAVAAVLLTSKESMISAALTVVLLFVVAVALHARLYDSRPDISRLTLFYLVMALGGALGGVFTALIAPVLFDWTWEHPLLLVLAALLVPLPAFARWTDRFAMTRDRAMVTLAVVVAITLVGIALLFRAMQAPEPSVLAVQGLLVIVIVGALLTVRWRPAFAAFTALAMLAVGGINAVELSVDGTRTRSYFGIYTVRTDDTTRRLVHGTTLHGVQLLDPAQAREPTTYYGRTSGIGLALEEIAGSPSGEAAIGVVGLGAGTLACYKRPGQRWTFYEIDPAVLAYSTKGDFTFLDRCAPDARTVLGDARLSLAEVPPASYDVLAIDAFSSDAVPLHLLTDEAIKVYLRSLKPDGVLMVHISNRFVNLRPAIAAAARHNGLSAAIRIDRKVEPPLTGSDWVALTRDSARLERLRASNPSVRWKELPQDRREVWTDDYASILRDITWRNFL